LHGVIPYHTHTQPSWAKVRAAGAFVLGLKQARPTYHSALPDHSNF
jgi:hypothetical protein